MEMPPEEATRLDRSWEEAKAGPQPEEGKDLQGPRNSQNDEDSPEDSAPGNMFLLQHSEAPGYSEARSSGEHPDLSSFSAVRTVSHPVLKRIRKQQVAVVKKSNAITLSPSWFYLL